MTTSLTTDQATALMLDLGWLCALLLLGKLLRSRIPLLQRLFLPAALIAGAIGLLAGPDGLGRLGLGLVPQETLQNWAVLPSHLISVVFACLFLGFGIPSLKTIWREGGPQLCYGVVVGLGQYVVGVGLSLLVLKPLFGVPSFFGCLLEIGFSGGHGTAAGMREAFDQLGFPAGVDLGLMSATLGIIGAMVFGMLMINIAARRGYATELTGPAVLSIDVMRGLIPPDQRKRGSTTTVSPHALEPFAFHAAFVGLAILIGWFLLSGIKHLSALTEADLFRSFPLFPLAMIGGLLVQLFSAKTGVADYLDRQSFDRILGIALDFLVVAAVASIRIDVILSYFWPFAILISAGLAWIAGLTWFLAPHMLPDAWFERSITEYGMQTGVTAMGLLLLRVVDPQFRTSAAKSFGYKQIAYEPILGGGFITAAAPLLLTTYSPGRLLAIAVAAMGGSLLIAHASGWLRYRAR